jgi:hypothetical protein
MLCSHFDNIVTCWIKLRKSCASFLDKQCAMLCYMEYFKTSRNRRSRRNSSIVRMRLLLFNRAYVFMFLVYFSVTYGLCRMKGECRGTSSHQSVSKIHRRSKSAVRHSATHKGYWNRTLFSSVQAFPLMHIVRHTALYEKGWVTFVNGSYGNYINDIQQLGKTVFQSKWIFAGFSFRFIGSSHFQRNLLF